MFLDQYSSVSFSVFTLSHNHRLKVCRRNVTIPCNEKEKDREEFFKDTICLFAPLPETRCIFFLFFWCSVNHNLVDKRKSATSMCCVISQGCGFRSLSSYLKKLCNARLLPTVMLLPVHHGVAA